MEHQSLKLPREPKNFSNKVHLKKQQDKVRQLIPEPKLMSLKIESKFLKEQTQI